MKKLAIIFCAFVALAQVRAQEDAAPPAPPLEPALPQPASAATPQPDAAATPPSDTAPMPPTDSSVIPPQTDPAVTGPTDSSVVAPSGSGRPRLGIKAKPTPPPLPPVAAATQAFALTPGKNAIFFSDKLVYQQELESEATSDAPGGQAIYPKQNADEHTAVHQLKKFFTGMFSSVQIIKGGNKSQSAARYLQIVPGQFSLQDRHEVSADYTIRNTGRRMVRLEYPNGQRVEVITTDASGKVIDKWSDDRTFDPEGGMVVINPGERIQYSEKIPTRDMKPGQTYKVQAQATTVTSPYYSTTTSIVPQP